MINQKKNNYVFSEIELLRSPCSLALTTAQKIMQQKNSFYQNHNLYIHGKTRKE